MMHCVVCIEFFTIVYHSTTFVGLKMGYPSPFMQISDPWMFRNLSVVYCFFLGPLLVDAAYQ